MQLGGESRLVGIFKTASSAAADKVKACHHPFAGVRCRHSSVPCSPIDASKNFANKILTFEDDNFKDNQLTMKTSKFTSLKNLYVR